jgi:NADH-quinone oxidoreductase subunit M
MNVLTAVIFLPLVGSGLTLLLPKENEKLVRVFTLIWSLVTFAVSLVLISGLSMDPRPSASAFSYDVNVPWINVPPIRYHIGIDGISLWLVLLTTLLTPICILISWNYIAKHVHAFHAFMLLLECGLIGVFCSLDLFLFFVFWEVSLVPMYFLIGIWGYDRRIYAALKFFVYTMAGSALMLVGIIYLYNRTGTFDYPSILAALQNGTAHLTYPEEMLLFLGFFIAFAIKVPLFPLHTWLPDAHVEAPTPGSIMLASVMLKMGTYGLLRFCLPLFPTAARNNAGWINTLAIIGIVYGALVAMVQPNMKKLVAYSSISHLGFVVLGLFTFTQPGLDGAVYQMLNHGVTTGAMFMLVGFLYERRHSLEIKAYGGVATPAPGLSTVFMITMLASIGLPTLNNFIGEYLVLQGAAIAHFRWAVFASIGVILSACYMLWLYQRVFYGRATADVSQHMHDLVPREYFAIVPLIFLMVWMGVFSQTFMPPISAANTAILGPIDARKEMQVRNRQAPPPNASLPASANLREIAHAR